MKQNNPFDGVTQEAPSVLEQGTRNKTNILIRCVTLGAQCQEPRSEVKG